MQDKMTVTFTHKKDRVLPESNFNGADDFSITLPLFAAGGDTKTDAIRNSVRKAIEARHPGFYHIEGGRIITDVTGSWDWCWFVYGPWGNMPYAFMEEK
jgi:hypothetical protein